MSPHHPTVIIGAGLGGLALALGLARAGREVHVYEQATELGEVGAGISLSPNAVKALRYLGLGDAVRAQADEPPIQITRHFETGEVLVHIDRKHTEEKLGAPYLQMHRADLHQLLTDAYLELKPDGITLAAELTNVSQEGDIYKLDFSNGTQCSTDLLIGADGLKSTVRSMVFTEDDAEFTGYIAWRGLIPTDDVAELELQAGSSVFISPGRICVRYPVRQGAIQNVVAFSKADDWAAEGWSQTGKLSTLQTLFSDFHPEVNTVLGAFKGTEIHKWGLFARQPLQQWIKTNAAVLGDAAHPMLPWFGQGAATALEDAVIMSRCLIEFENTREALEHYQDGRLERVTEVHLESHRGGDTLMGQDPYALAKNPLRTEDTLGLTMYDPATVAL